MTEKKEAFKEVCQKLIAASAQEAKCLYYGYSFDGQVAYCREGYEDADGLLKHLEHVDALLQEALQLSDLNYVEVHGPEQELAKLREPLAPLNPRFFVLEYGFRKLSP